MAGRAVSLAATACLALGIALRLRAFVFNRSLWMDEAALAINVRDVALWPLLSRPLPEYQQAAPAGFLALAKLLTETFGSTDLVLRVVPLAASLVALGGLYGLCRHYYSSRTAVLATAAMALSETAIYYATEFKQYGVDALVGVGLLWVFHTLTREGEWRRSQIAVLLAGGVAAIVFSHPAILTLAAMGIVLTVRALQQADRTRLAYLVPCGVIWLLVFATLYLATTAGAVGQANFASFHAASFAPWPTSEAAVVWYVKTAEATFMYAVTPSLWWLSLSVCATGIVSAWRTERRAVVWLMIATAACLWIASLLRVYPLQPRFLLFIYPLVFLFLGIGLDALLRFAPTTVALLLLPLLAPLVFERATTLVHPSGREETRGLVQRIFTEPRPTDRVLVWHDSVPAFRWYAPGQPFVAIDARGGAVDADRYWVLASHSLPPTLPPNSRVEREWTATGAVLYLARTW